jgi:hypothetical protein
MNKVVGFIGATIGGSLGWWAGSGVGIMTSFFISIFGTALGGYYAKRWADDHLP